MHGVEYVFSKNYTFLMCEYERKRFLVFRQFLDASFNGVSCFRGSKNGSKFQGSGTQRVEWGIFR